MNKSCLALILLVVAAPVAHAQPAQWAVLIGVQKHVEQQLDLGCTTGDVARLRQVLHDRGGVPENHMLVMTDESPAQRQPTLANLRREVPQFLKKVGKDDRIIVFYAGHGFLRDGKTYLVPKDTNTGKLDTTALPAAELNKALENAPGKLKFLILDCCHAGGGQRALLTIKEEAAETLADEVQPKNGVVILASCKKGESSWEWADHRQGMFSFWLCQALQGAADANGDGVVDVDEIYNFTHERVSGTVKKLFGKDQTPVRMIDASVDGVSPVLTLLPEPADSLLKRLAQELDLELRMRKIKKVGVLEFVATLGKAEKLAQSNLPRYCAGKLHDLLAELGEGAYQVVDDGKLGPAARGMMRDDIDQPVKLTKLGASAGGMGAVLTGGLRRHGANLHVQCDLISIADGSSLARPVGVLPLSEDLLGDLGYSFDTVKRAPGAPTDKNVIASAQNRLVLGNPLDNAAFPFKIEVVIVEPRPGEMITDKTRRRIRQMEKINGAADDPNVRSELVLGVRAGEIMELKVTNDSLDKVAMNLYVDGLNTIGERRELVGKGSAWVLDRDKPFTVAGWAFPRRKELKRFQFVDLPQSVAGRQNYGDSIGTITAAFYGPAGRALGVGEGLSERRTFRTDVKFQPGRLLGIVNIRYVDEKSLR